MKKILLLQVALIFLFCTVVSTTTLGQRKTKPQRPKKSKPAPSPANDVFADAKTLTAKEKEYVLKILKALDGSDAIFSTSLDPYRFKNSLERVIKMTEDADKELHKGMFRDALMLTTLAYLDFGVLVSLGATRHTQGKVEITDDQAENLGEMKRRYSEILNIQYNEDLLDEDNVAKLYRHAMKLKEGLYLALK